MLNYNIQFECGISLLLGPIKTHLSDSVIPL